MMFLVKYAREKGIDDIKPTAITTTGNVLTNEARNLIENQFSCKIISYSCEGSPVLFERVQHMIVIWFPMEMEYLKLFQMEKRL